MSKASRLAVRLAKIQARIAEIEAIYPTICKLKSYSKGFGEVSTTYQDFGDIAKEYQSLLRQEESIEDQLAEWNDAENGGSFAASFREIQ